MLVQQLVGLPIPHSLGPVDSAPGAQATCLDFIGPASSKSA